MGRFDGSVAVVTGAGGGLGRASAERLAAEGASRGRHRHQRRYRGAGGRRDRQQVDRRAGRHLQRIRRAALHRRRARPPSAASTATTSTRGSSARSTALPEISVDDFQRVMDVNVRGQFLGLRAAFRQYAQQGSAGAIVLTASIASITGSADLLPYVNLETRCLRPDPGRGDVRRAAGHPRQRRRPRHRADRPVRRQPRPRRAVPTTWPSAPAPPRCGGQAAPRRSPPSPRSCSATTPPT